MQLFLEMVLASTLLVIEKVSVVLSRLAILVNYEFLVFLFTQILDMVHFLPAPD